jgi:hypothetical protein
MSCRCVKIRLLLLSHIKGKVVPVLNLVACHENAWGSSCIGPPFLTSALVSGQLYAPEPVCMLWNREKSLAPNGNLTMVVQSAAILTAPSQLLIKLCSNLNATLQYLTTTFN